MAEKGSEISTPSIKSLQSDSGVDSEGQPGSVGSFPGLSPPSSFFNLIGYDMTMFIKSPGVYYLCGICNNVARWPVQTECGCGLFCHGCLHRYISDSTGELECPRCAEMFPVKEIHRDKIAHKKLQKLEVLCPHGCKTELLLKDFDRHEEECQFVRVDCVNKSQGCPKSVQRSNLAEHLEDECEFRTVFCKHCNQQCQANQLEEHQKKCAFTEPVSHVLSNESGEGEPGTAGGQPGASQELVKNVATNLEAKIAEVKRMTIEIDNDCKMLKTLVEDNRTGISENRESLLDLDKSIKNLQVLLGAHGVQNADKFTQMDKVRLDNV